MTELTKAEQTLKSAIQTSYAADDTWTKCLEDQGLHRWSSCAAWNVDTRNAYDAKLYADECMHQAFRDCRASGSMWPILTR